MGDYYYRLFVVSRHFEKKFKHENSRFGVKSPRRFVAKKDFRVFRKRAGDRNSLLFAARKLRGEIF